MFTQLNEKLTDVKEQYRKKQKWTEHIHRAEKLLEEEEKKKQKLKQLFQKEQKDVERLEKFSIANLLYTISGRKLEKLEKEKQEALAAELKYKEAEATVKDLKEEIAQYKMLLETVQNSEKTYKTLLAEKEKLLVQSDSSLKEKLSTLLDHESDLQMLMNEYKEAIDAGVHAEKALEEAIDSLNKAKNWSTFDMFGGGMLSTMVKHSHLDSAKDDIHHVQQALRHFQDELLDIKDHFHIDLKVGNFLTFADYFFDGLIVDWMVHGKISDSLKQAETMKENLRKMLHRLRNDVKKLTEDLEKIKNKRYALLEEL